MNEIKSMGKNTVVVVRQEGLGQVAPGDRQFGLDMFERFIHTLEGEPLKPRAICFYTEGVKLACKGSPALMGLRLIEGMGTRILICQTCLEHYGLKGKAGVGTVCGMNEIVRALMESDHVVTV